MLGSVAIHDPSVFSFPVDEFGERIYAAIRRDAGAALAVGLCG